MEALGISSIEQTFNDPTATFWDKLGAIGSALFNDANNLLMAAMILGGPEDDAVLGGGEALTKGGEEALAQEGANLLNELKATGAKFSEENIVGIIRTPEGKINWLETGNLKAGLIHIMARHGSDFADAFGITSEQDVSNLILDTLANRTPVAMQRDAQIFSNVSWGNFIHDLSIVVGDNGFVVTAMPYSP
ncbi:MAG TPA: hypothetical protein VKV20_13150 [Ktedonobacteraceae bacterium]|jgi:hypothetical protein|nr:hypothetical protein [Ktedonobacteraceae bacterium]